MQNNDALAPRAVVALAFCCLIAMLDGADAQAMAITAPLMAKDLDIGAAQMGLTFSASLFGAAVGALLGGQLADRFGAKTVLAGAAMLFGLLQLATALADRFETPLLLRTIAGIGLGGATPAFLALAAASVPTTWRSRILGLVWACFPLGAFVGGFFNGWLAQHRSWQEVFIYGGVAPIVLALLLYIFASNPSAETTTSSAANARSRLGRLLGEDGRLRSRTILLCIVFFGVFGTLAGIVVWLPSILIDQNFEPAQGRAVLSWHALGAIVSTALGGFFFEKFGGRVLTISLLTGFMLMIALSVSLSVFSLAAISMMLLGVFLGLGASAAIATGGLLFAPKVRSSGLGLAMASGRFGQMLLPSAIGLGLSNGLTATEVLLASAVLPLISALAAILLNLSD